MYCSFCGTALTAGLSYCNRCGAELGPDRSAARPKEAPQESLVWAIVAVTVVGLGGIIGLMAVMKEVLHFNDAPIIAFSLLNELLLGVEPEKRHYFGGSRKKEKETYDPISLPGSLHPWHRNPLLAALAFSS
jgi:hypothetical protein